MIYTEEMSNIRYVIGSVECPEDDIVCSIVSERLEVQNRILEKIHQDFLDLTFYVFFLVLFSYIFISSVKFVIRKFNE